MMEVLLASATSWEIRPLVKTLLAQATAAIGNARSFHVAGGRILLETVILGIGSARAQRHLTEALSRHRPQILVLAGFSGAVQPHQRVGDIAYANVFCRDTGGPEYRFSPMPLQTGVARAIGVQRLAGAVQKKELGTKWPDAIGVDMESYSVAAIAAEMGIDFYCMRAIFDEMGQDPPTALSLITRPWEIVQWYARYRMASTSLARALQAFLEMRVQHTRFPISRSVIVP